MGQCLSIQESAIAQENRKMSKMVEGMKRKGLDIQAAVATSQNLEKGTFTRDNNCQTEQYETEFESPFGYVEGTPFFNRRGVSQFSSEVTLERVLFNNSSRNDIKVRNNSGDCSENFMPIQESVKRRRSQQDTRSVTSYIARKTSKTSDYGSSIQNSDGLRDRSVSVDLVTENYARDANPLSAKINVSTLNLEELWQGEEFYGMNNLKRGDCIIFNVATIGGEIRAGTEKDVSRLNATFRDLGFDVHVKTDPTKAEIDAVIKNYAGKDHSQDDCFACVILSHGKQGHVFTTNEEQVSLDEIMDPIKKCPSLLGKPKLFFIQACRGTNTDPGVLVTDAAVDITGSNIRKLSTHLDVLVSYATVEDFVAYRNVTEGSIYISILTQLLQKQGFTAKVPDILIQVNSMTSKALAHSKFCQVPSFTSTFRKTLLFTKKKRVVQRQNIVYYDDGTRDIEIEDVANEFYI